MIFSFPPSEIRVQFNDSHVLPSMIRMHQSFPNDTLEHPEDQILLQLRQYLSDTDLSGKRVAITVGSRGIPHLKEMVKAIINAVEEKGGQPFLVPCMGSHGGATAEGQRAVIAGYGITEDSMGVPILSSMETVQYAELNGLKLYCDKNAAEADEIIVFNKIKPHTMFHGNFESGLAKMMTVGLGKHKGADAFHALGFDHFAENLPKTSALFLKHFPVLCGISVIQNELDGICRTAVIAPERIAEEEPKLLAIARSRMPRIPIHDVDVLIVDEVGKNISGSGFDPNIFGRWGDPLHHEHTATRFQKLYIASLTPESHGLGTGAFFADFASQRMVSSVDWSATWTNCVTCNLAAPRGIPIYFNTDAEALSAMMKILPQDVFAKPKILRVKNTLELDDFDVSPALYEELKSNNELETISEFRSVAYDNEGFLIPFDQC